MRITCLLFTLLVGLSLTKSADAATCNINFNYGVIIDDNHIRITEMGISTIQINGSNQLFVRGREVFLDEEQAALVAQYSAQIREQIPEIVSIALKGVNVGLKAVNRVIAGLTGENSASHQQLQSRFEELEWRIKTRFNHSDNNYYIAPQDLDDFDEIFAGEFEQELQSIVSESIGTILMAVGEAIADNNAENQDKETRAISFDQRMESMGEELELDIVPKANKLAERAEKVCQTLTELDILEEKLKEKIPQLAEINLLGTE